jgi:hypothetical protein
MACKKYAGWLTHAALGQLLAPSRYSELVAHLGNCESCREDFQRTQTVLSLADRAVNALTSGEPSSHFVPRLRVRIANESARVRSAWAARVPIAASTLIFIAIVGITAAKWIERDAARAPLAVVASIPSEPAIATTSAVRAAAADRKTPSMRVDPHAALRQRTPDVLVAPGQMQALLRLAEVTRHRRASFANEVARHDELGQPLEITPIEIQQLDVSKIEDFDSSGGF